MDKSSEFLKKYQALENFCRKAIKSEENDRMSAIPEFARQCPPEIGKKLLAIRETRNHLVHGGIEVTDNIQAQLDELIEYFSKADK